MARLVLAKGLLFRASVNAVLLFLLLLLALGIVTNPMDLQATISSEVTDCLLGEEIPILRRPYKQKSPALAHEKRELQGNYLLVWEEEQNASGRDDVEIDIYAVGLSSTGIPIGEPVGITKDIAGHQRNPVIAYNSDDGEFMVAWKDARDGRWGIYAQRVRLGEGELELIGSNFLVAADTGNPRPPAIAYRPRHEEDEGVYLVVWKEHDGEIRGQLVSPDGELRNHPFYISTAAAAANEKQTVVSAAYNRDQDEFLVVWAEKSRNAVTIFGRIVSVTGVPVDERFLVSATEERQRSEPVVTYNAGHYLVVWQSRSGSQSDPHVYGRLIPGRNRGEDHPISTEVGWQGQLAIGSIADRYLVTWGYKPNPTLSHNDDDNSDIYGTWVLPSDDGRPNPLAACAIGDGANKQEHPAIACSEAESRCLVVWQDSRGQGTTSWDIVGRMVEVALDPNSSPDPKATWWEYLPVVMNNHLIECSSSYIQNPGFEAGNAAPWSIGGSTRIVDVLPYTGTYSAWLGGQNNTFDYLYQDINVPADMIRAKLSFWYRLDSNDPNQGSDRFSVFITDRDGTPLITVADKDNTMRSESYQHLSYSFGPAEREAVRKAKGRIRVHFELKTNSTHETGVLIDDVVLEVCH